MMRPMTMLMGWGEMPIKVVATCYDSKEDLVRKYPDVKDIVREIKASGVTVHTGIDATKLLQSKRLVRSLADLCESEGQTFQDDDEQDDNDDDKQDDEDDDNEDQDDDDEREGGKKGKTVTASVGFDRILFNFPHLGCGITDTEKNNQVHREFLAEFFVSAHTVLSAQGQVHVTIKSGEPYDSWRIAQVAVNTGLFKVHSQLAFDPAVYDGYEHRRTLGANASGDVEANTDITKMPARTFVFMKADAESARAKRRAASREKREKRRRAATAAGDEQAMEMYEMNDSDAEEENEEEVDHNSAEAEADVDSNDDADDSKADEVQDEADKSPSPQNTGNKSIKNKINKNKTKKKGKKQSNKRAR
ncbi:25S rRNA uridine-N3-methyltransferase [Hondaea fermentalgiana]|uniref:25S rRNA uridine-N3-methyltransferase n=1 Tax=Hondaea fermentalgiana TaxID=2315210 RepID=A0A2R5G433_9STRA|nr:25S rRNA uridine-N3-methyltransferase [Hondaea fermentalgiana]|eukprot:GBG25069.1 25S rRNA uridine-N3-methyltransferase [Hondaea fermentalgiana]